MKTFVITATRKIGEPILGTLGNRNCHLIICLLLHYEMVKNEDREVILHVFMEGANLTEKGSLTYLYNIKRKLNKKS